MSSVISSAVFSDDISQKSSHYHDCHQILFIQNGSISLSINGIVKTATTGDLIIISRFEDHAIRVLSDVYERYVLRITPDLSDRSNAYAILTNRPEHFENIIPTGTASPQITAILKNILSETARNDNFSEQMCDLLTDQLLLHVCRLEPSSATNLNDDSFNILFKIQKRLENNCAESYTLPELAREYHISVSTLSHRFKKVTGASVYEYLTFCRLARAKHYLSETTLSISEIVEKCGFTDASNFSRTFKKQFAVSHSISKSQFSSVKPINI